MTDNPSGPELAAELEHLRARLVETEEVLRAIRNGEVDGVLVTGGRGEQVYTLRGADRIYRQLIETMSEGAVTVSADGVILYCNVRLAEMLGQPLDRVMGTALRNYLPPADQQALDAILAQARTEPSRREINLKSSEGRLVPVYLSAFRLPGEGAEVVFCLVLTDLTEQKHHEQVVAEERLARLILEQSAEAIVVCDEQGRVMRASQTAERLCDGSPLRRPFAEVFPLQTDASVPFHLAPVLQGETLRSVDVTLDRQGQKLDLILNAGPLLSGQQILGCVVTLTDITERKRVEDALAESQRELEAIFDAAADGILLAETESGRFQSANASICRMLGYSRDEMLDLGVSDLFRKEDLAHAAQEFERHAKGDTSISAGLPVKRKDGSTFFADINSAPVMFGDKACLVAIFRDVTARKRAEENLDRSAQRLSLATESALIGIWDLDLERNVLIWDKRMYELYGIRPEDFSGAYEAWKKGVHPADVVTADADVKDAIAGTRQLHTQFRVVWPDGQVHHLEAHAMVQRGPDGTPRRMIGVNWDITERKQAEAMLHESEVRYRGLFEANPQPLWVYDLETLAFLQVNDAAVAHYGYRRDEFLTMTIAEIRPAEDAARLLADIAHIDDDAMGEGSVWRHRKKDGSTIDVEITAHAVDHGGRRARLVLAHDITARKRAEESLRLESAALQAAADAIVITNRAGVIEWVNPAFIQLTGYTAEEAVGKNPRDLVKSGKHAPAFYQDLWETILAGRTWHGEMINRRKDGSLYTEDQAVTPILDASGTITHFVAIKKDIAERLQLEAQFRQAQKMDSVGQLASGIAHDFNNLLTVINGMSDLLLAQVRPDDPMSADVREIRRAGERAATLTQQLLAFSRQQILETRVMSLNTVVTGMESLLRRLLGEDIDLMVVLTPGVGNVKADPGQIEQVITNLAVNARDAMPQGGRLTIETQSVMVDKDYARQLGVTSVTMPSGSYVLLAVSDSGTGMDEATRTRIFEPFFTTKGPGKGAGLGLSTVYGIVKQSHGFVWVYSEVGQGTSFKMYLPRVTEAAGPDQPGPTVVSSSGTETILLAEDNAGLRRLATRLLAPAGYTVLGAASGEEALRLLERHDAPVHLLLSDVVMPGMSGRDLAEHLAQTRPEIKVLYMSGYTSDTIVRHGVLEAQVPFLNKPFTAAALLRKVREVLDS
jgi:PAS domain S-box-containing protein